MSVFDFDSEIPFAEYVDTITRHAEMFKPQPKTPEGLLALANSLKDSIVEQRKNGAYDVAYYYCIKSLQIFDDKKTAVPLNRKNPAVKSVLLWLVNSTESIKAKGLPAYYQKRIEELKRLEPERQKILARQMELDAEAESQKEHNIRRQQLLSATTADERHLLNALGGAHGNSADGFYGNTTNRTTTLPPTLYGSAYTYSPSPTPVTQLQTAGPVTPSPAPQPSSTPTGGVAASWRFPGGPRTTSFPRRGIVNLGNTCYMNSVIQVLNVTPLADFFMSDRYVNDLVERTGNYSRVVNAFSFVIRELHRAHCSYAVGPSSLKSAVGAIYEPFDNSKQQDANEFLRVIMDAVHSGLNANAACRTVMPEIDNTQGTDSQLARAYWWQYTQKNASVVVEMCGFQERSMVTCPQCGRSSRSFFPTLGIEVPVPRGNDMTLEKCLAKYCAEEVLDNDSLYQCSGCGRKVNARKQLQLYSAPQILFITLKRFQHMGDFSNVSKVTSNVFFQQYLDVAPYMCSQFPSTQYQLIGIVNHQGNMHGGHYTADACGGGSWFHASDEVVTDATAPNPSLAYILCYRRRDA